jgi:hypothetical protein
VVPRPERQSAPGGRRISRRLRKKLGGDELDESEWTAAWNDDLVRRMSQIERGEVHLLSEDEFFAKRDE